MLAGFRRATRRRAEIEGMAIEAAGYLGNRAIDVVWTAVKGRLFHSSGWESGREAVRLLKLKKCSKALTQKYSNKVSNNLVSKFE